MLITRSEVNRSQSKSIPRRAFWALVGVLAFGLPATLYYVFSMVDEVYSRACDSLRVAGSDAEYIAYLRNWSHEKLTDPEVLQSLGVSGTPKNQSNLPSLLDLNTSVMDFPRERIALRFNRNDEAALKESIKLDDFLSLTINADRSSLRILLGENTVESTISRLDSTQAFRKLSEGVFIRCE